MNAADQQGGVASIGLTGGGEVPLWIYNRMPEGMMQPSPTTLLSAWQGTGPTGSHYESWWLPVEQRASGALLYLRQAMEHYRDHPALSAWHLYGGSPGAELSYHDRFGEFWDYSPVGVAAFRTWLRQVRKYDLPALGQLWYSDRAHFTSWEQVQIPDVNGFYGALGQTALRLADGWRVATARNGIQTPPPPDDPSWIPVAMPPSQQQVLVPWGESFFRVEFDAKEWATRSRAWLVCDALSRSTNPVVVWLNGEKLGETVTNAAPISFSIAGRLKQGKNELVVRVPRNGPESSDGKEIREGRIIGPVFLTATEPVAFPYLGQQANARYVDVREWQAAGVTSSHRTLLQTALALDPNHPFNLSGSAQEVTDQMSLLAEEFGASVQHTGREAWYHPWWAGIGLLGGFYGTSEESAQTTGISLTRELGRMMLDGDSNHNLFYSLDGYQVEERKTGWFTQHQRAIELFGKYLRAMPRVAILRSARTMRLGSREPWNWDLGPGELQAIHFDNAYATETELLKGFTDLCPVLFDAGTEVMDDDVVQALERYIERGGTYIALHQTGRHSKSTQDAQPLARLTGLIAEPRAAGTVRVVGGASVLNAWAGREFTGAGFVLHPAPGGVAVPGEAPVAIATWADGGIAIAARRIGKGRVIQIASPFWRDHSKLEDAFLVQLLGDLGVRRDSGASLSAIWARKATTKNGLQDWLLTFNNGDASHTADVRLAVAEKPAEVWDMIARKPVAASYENGFVTIPGVAYAPWELHIFGVKRAGSIAALPFWWAEKTRYWRRPPAATSPAVAAASQRLASSRAFAGTNTETIPFHQWRFLADRDGKGDATPQWIQPGFDDNHWRSLETGAWNLLDPALADWRGASLYRAAFAVPDRWKGRRVLLNLADYDLPIVYDHGEFFLNGTKVATYEAHGWSQAYAYDVTSLLRPGANVLAVRVRGGKEFSGICGNVWLEPEERFSAETDLAGTWRIVKADFKSEALAQLPGKPTGRYLVRDVDLPAAWTGKTAFLHMETEGQWLGSIVVNGHLINTNSYIHPFSPRCEVNLTPYLVPGRNRIELWPYATIPAWFQDRGKVDEMPMPVTAIRLGILDAAERRR
jgi:hypothetical protein